MQDLRDRIGNLGGHPLLYLRAAGDKLHHPDQAGKAGDGVIFRDVGQMDPAEKRQQMMLTDGEK